MPRFVANRTIRYGNRIYTGCGYSDDCPDLVDYPTEGNPFFRFWDPNIMFHAPMSEETYVSICQWMDDNWDLAQRLQRQVRGEAEAAVYMSLLKAIAKG